jgi:excisionase family DNA binding protein
MTLDELDGQNFASAPEVAEILGMDERSVRRAIAAGEIPATKVGARYLIPVAWLRAQASGGLDDPLTVPAQAAVISGELAAAVADRVVAQLARAFAALADQEPP